MNTQRVTNLNKLSVDTGELNRQVPGLVLVEQEWEHVLQTIPMDLEETARQTQALQRRREIKSAAELLRLILAYCVGDWPLRLVGMWAQVQELGSLSDVAVLKRLQKSGPWLELLISGMLETRCLALKTAQPARVRIVDGSSLSVPGSQGTDYRLHLSWDLGSQRASRWRRDVGAPSEPTWGYLVGRSEIRIPCGRGNHFGCRGRGCGPSGLGRFSVGACGRDAL